MNSPPIILKSDKVTALDADETKLTGQGKHWSAEISRLTNLRYPGFSEPTVLRLTPKELTSRAGVVSTGNSEQNEAARKAESIRRTLAGEHVDYTDTKAELEHAHKRRAEVEDALEFINREQKRERDALGAQHCKLTLPEHEEKMRRLFKALLEAHAVHSELSEMRRQFVDSAIPTRGILQLMPDIDEILGNWKNPHCRLADLFRAGKRDGYISKVPSELVL
jgi:hypothetical protein